MVKGWAADITPLYDKEIYNILNGFPVFGKKRQWRRQIL